MRRPHVVLSVLSMVAASVAVHPALSAASDPVGGRLSAFGATVAMAGDAVLVAETAPKGKGGMIHVYGRTPAGLWRETGSFSAPGGAAGDGFGTVMTADGNTALVTWHTSTADSMRGGVLAFRKDAAGKWTSTGPVGPAAPAASSRFGASLALSGDWAFVGATGEQPHGNVHVYHRTASGWEDQGTLGFPAGNEPAASDMFGRALAVSGDWLAVGASNRDGKGAVYLYHRDASGKWNPESNLLQPTVPSNSQFGSALLFHANHLLVGAPVANSSTGLVVMYQRDAATGKWSTLTTLQPFESGPARFGASMAVAGGNEFWVAAPYANQNIGAVYRYQGFDGHGFKSVTRMVDDSATGLALYGLAMAAGPSTAVVAMPADGGGEGTVVFYGKAASGAWTPAKRVFIPTPEFAAVTGAEVRCTNGMAKDFQCGNTSLMSFLPISAIGGKRGTHLNDDWGWTDPTTGREYALIGRTDGTSFVDITDPIHPRYLGDLPLTPGAHAAAWRDIKTYKNYAFIVSDGAGPHGMQVFNLTRLRGVKVPQTFTEDAHYDRIASAHNIVINEQSGFAYAVGVNGPATSPEGGETCGGGLHMIDIHDPLHPTFVGCFQDTQTGNSKTGYSHDAVCVMYHGPDTRYTGHEICMGSNETAISVADVTDKKHPVAVAHASYPDVGYTHQGWFTDDQKYFYVDDELDEMNGKGEAAKGTRTLVWDMAKLDDPVLIQQHIGVSKSIDHNLYVKGNRLYEANYTSGLRILDISDPRNPREVGFFDTFPDGDPVEFDGAWSNYPYFKSGTIMITSIGQGVFFVKDRSAIVP